MALFVAMGWGTAAQTFVGQNLGANKSARAKQSGWVTVGYDAITNVLLIAFVYAYGEAILRVFDDEAAPVAIALQYLQVVAPSYIALGVGIVLGNAMAGAGATRTTFAIDAVVILALEVPLGIVVIGVMHGSLRALFQCVAVVNVASAFAYAAIYARGTWLGAVARTR
jgi:Na+-driven multidrug efflux pump